MRTQLLGLLTSMALLSVATVGLGLINTSALKTGTVSFAFVAAMNCSTGKPIFQANKPAPILPKLPLGTANTTFFLPWRSNCA
jgi:hypothetical protein